MEEKLAEIATRLEDLAAAQRVQSDAHAELEARIKAIEDKLKEIQG
jgi:hypothetical protein